MYTVRYFLAVVALTVSACTEQAADGHPGQPVTQRRALFKDISRALEQMGMVLRERKAYDPQEFTANAIELDRLSTLPWAHFPPGSTYSPSHAKSEVWSEPETFKEMQLAFERATQQLLLASRAQDLAAIREAHALVVKRCRSCHEKFHHN